MKQSFEKTNWGSQMMDASLEKFGAVFKTYCNDELSKEKAPGKDHVLVEENVFGSIDLGSLYVDDVDFVNNYEKEWQAYLNSPRDPQKTEVVEAKSTQSSHPCQDG